MFDKLISFAKKANKWYVWLLVVVLIVCVLFLQVFGFVGCQSVKVYSDSSHVSVDGEFDLDPQTSVEAALNNSYMQPTE